MQIFRKKYLYNSEKPVYASDKVKTFQCMNTETKDQRFLILQHLDQPPYVEPSPSILQPVQFPTTAQPFSVYPLVECCSNIKKINQYDAMYVLKCLLQAKLKKPIYYVLSPQGICASQIQGLLPQKSPSLFQIAITMLDIPQSLSPVQKSPISKECFDVCRQIKNGDNPFSIIAKYGWKDIKKDKSNPTDSQFWIFRGRRKQQGPFGDQYGLAWNGDFNLCRFRYIDLSKDGYQEQFYEDFKKKVQTFQKAHQQKIDVLKIYKYQKDSKGIKIFSQISNQGSLSDYINTKHNQGKSMTQKNSLGILQNFVQAMKKIRQQTILRAFGTLHLKNIFVHNNKFYIGQPLLITDKVQKKIRQLKNGMDYFSPQLKQNILLAQNLLKLDAQKMDVWFFGFMLHKIFMREVPVFDPTRKPLLAKQKFSAGMNDLIVRCLSLSPANRPSWSDINLSQLSKKLYVQQVLDIEQPPQKQIKLGTRKERISSRQSMMRSNKVQNEYNSSSNKKMIKQQQIQQENQKLNVQDAIQQKQPQVVVPTHPKFRRFKMILKVILVMVLYVFLFFRPFLGGSINLLLVRGYYTISSIHLISKTGDITSTATILTNQPQYFMMNDISFTKLYSQLHCIDNRFNPIYDPNFQINTFIQSGSFLTLILLGWIAAIVICVTKAVSLWKGGISNQPGKNMPKYWIVYGFHELSLAALLFAHFYIFQFFYFSLAQPCLGILNFKGIQPLFDSSIYMFLGNTQDYMRTVFACLGILGFIILFSTCFYAWGPKIDTKNFFSVLSIIFRVLPYVLFILFCRIGIFYVLDPTAINDNNKILQSLVSDSFVGFLGVIPQIFIIIVVVFEVLYEFLIKKLQKKIMQSSKLSRLFGLKKGKGNETISKVSKLQQSKLNDMSLDNSKHQLVLQD